MWVLSILFLIVQWSINAKLMTQPLGDLSEFDPGLTL